MATTEMNCLASGGGGGAHGTFQLTNNNGEWYEDIDTGVKNLKRFCAMGQIMSINRRNIIAWDSDWTSGNDKYFVTCSPYNASAGNVANTKVPPDSTSNLMYFYIADVDTANGIVRLHGGTKSNYEEGSGYWFAE